MVNHFRTLLLNKKAGDIAHEAGEYVSTSFVPTKLPYALQQAYDALFRLASTSEELNVLAHKYMTAVHSSQFGAYVTELDNRLTYRLPLRNLDVSAEVAAKLDLASIVAALDSLPEAVIAAIFGESKTAPYDSFYTLWALNRNFTLKLAGFLLAFVYRHDEVRKNGQ